VRALGDCISPTVNSSEDYQTIMNCLANNNILEMLRKVIFDMG